MLIDSHAHLDFPQFDAERAQLFAQMRQANIAGAVIPAVERQYWSRVQQIAEQYHCRYGLGIHPWYMAPERIEDDISALDSALKQGKMESSLVAIGETGLDTRKGPALSIQLDYVNHHIELAQRYQLPLILHCVKAHNALLACLDAHTGIRGVIHGFSGSLELAQRYIRLGFFIGVGGLLLKDNARKLQYTVTQLPVNKIVVETDSPSMSPIPGQSSTPLLLPCVVEKIACLQKKTSVSIYEQLSVNASQLFER
ncbi:hydrolase TatD family protein [Shewanella sp. NFH-SH190041]|uniref:TatD family hydrolase n=1 Tax=Shewanella sp. NFH-SH190041 TaxID=2950245 RepID=UPI0021C42940|nr:TatD family hydrolase [Shewanella sp. NFH-SH190041]BDM65496.1 hydrolase TatD family protein [Shewanella sp. NFH-SH190041]